MSQPTIPLNIPAADPDLKTLLDAFKTDIMLATNCHAIATVQSVSQNSNGLLTVSATVNYSRTYFVQQLDGTYLTQQVSYPLLIDCPVVVLGGGTASLTFPVAQGDQCLIMFNDRDLDNWFAGAKSGPVASARLHSFSDGIALVGFNINGTYSTTHAMLSNGSTQIGASNSLVLINNSAGHSLGAILAALTSALHTFMTSVSAASSVAQVAAAASTANSAMATANTQIAGLLE